MLCGLKYHLSVKMFGIVFYTRSTKRRCFRYGYVHAMLPYLMRYMGHSSLESTYYYIHLIPDYFPKYRDLTSSTENLIPEVDDDEV